VNVLVFPDKASLDEGNRRLALATSAWIRDYEKKPDLLTSGRVNSERYTKTIWATNDGRYAFPLSRVVGRLEADPEGYLANVLFADIGAGAVPFELMSLDYFNQNLKIPDDS
jgi:hypothetical protein